MSFTELTRTSSRPPRPGGHLHIDATMGCAGDMLAAALLDLGLSLAVVRTALLEVGIVDVGPLVRERSQGRARGLHLSFVDVNGVPVDQPDTSPQTHHRPLLPTKGRARAPSPRREGRRAKGATVARALGLDDEGRPISDGGELLDPTTRAPRKVLLDWLSGRPVNGRELFALVERGRLGPAVRARTLKALRRVLDARAQATGGELLDVTVDGHAAVDLVCDLVAVSALIDALAPARITASSIALSPAPLLNDGALAAGPSTWVLHALAGMRTVERELPWECTTPTGAALLWTLAGAAERRPPLTIHRVGVGLGSKEAPGIVNATRALYAERRVAVDDGSVVRVEAVITALVDRQQLTRDLEQKRCRGITFGRVEDAHGTPFFRVDALVDVSDTDDDVRAVMEILDARGHAAAAFTGQTRSTPVEVVTVPVGRGAKTGAVRMRVKGNGATAVDEDVRRMARKLRVDEEQVRASASAAYQRLVDEGTAMGALDENGGGDEE